jgi:hypothetical protein
MPDLKSLTDIELMAKWQELEMDSECMADGVAEDESERAHYGDGPCGSMDRLNAYRKVNNQLDEVRKEWYVRYPLPVYPETPADEIPF